MKQSKTLHPILSMLIITLLLFGYTACTKDADEKDIKLSYRLKWLFNASVVGDLFADSNGIFREFGLDVAVKPGSPEMDAIKELEIGNANFGVASADQVIRAISKGAPIFILAQLFQVNPLQWIFRTDQMSILKPEDLKGKRIGITYGGNDEIIMRALLARYNISEQDVTFFSVRYDYTPFYERQVDLWPVYRNAQAVFIEKKLKSAGEKIGYMDPSVFGIQFVSNSVITSDKMLKEYPQTVKQFVTALMKAWEMSLDPLNAEKAIQTIYSFDKDTPVDIVKEQYNITQILIKPIPQMKVGEIDSKAWQQTEQIMFSQRLIPSPVYISNYFRPL